MPDLDAARGLSVEALGWRLGGEVPDYCRHRVRRIGDGDAVARRLSEGVRPSDRRVNAGLRHLALTTAYDAKPAPVSNEVHFGSTLTNDRSRGTGKPTRAAIYGSKRTACLWPHSTAMFRRCHTGHPAEQRASAFRQRLAAVPHSIYLKRSPGSPLPSHLEAPRSGLESVCRARAALGRSRVPCPACVS